MDGDELDIISDIQDGTVDAGTATPADISVSAPTQDGTVARVVKDAEKPAADDKPKSLRDQISSALKGQQDTPDAAQQDGRQRDAQGRFAPKVGEDGKPLAEAPAGALGDAAPPVAPIQAPRTLSAADLQLFNALPAELQTSFARTMEAVNADAARYAGYAHLEQVIAPRRDAWALQGMTEAQAISHLFALSDFAGRDPAGFIRYMADNAKIDLEELVYADDDVDPTVKQLQQQVSQLTQVLQGRDLAQQQTAHNAAVDEVISFGSEKDDKGNLLRPYLEELADDFLPYVQQEYSRNPNAPRAQILQQAYDNACWGVPTVRAKMQQAQAAAAEAETVRQRAEQAAKAKTAGVSISSGQPASAATPTGDSLSLRDTIKAAMAAAE